MTEAIFVFNAGSSSIKFAGDAHTGSSETELLGKGQVEGLRTEARFVCDSPAGERLAEHRWSGPVSHAAALDYVIQWIEANAPNVKVTAAGHRVVFGGTNYSAPTRLSDQVVDELDGLIPFFPLHLPHNLAANRALAEQHPTLPRVACFDNTFHRTLLPVAQWFALPRRMFEQGIRRYGFHGLSRRPVPEVARESARRIVPCRHG